MILMNPRKALRALQQHAGPASFLQNKFSKFEIRYYRENIYTTGDVRQCELRVAIITIGDQESAFPLPDYAQVYNNKNKDRRLYFQGEGAGKVRPGSFFGKSGGRTTESKKKVVGLGVVVRRQGLRVAERQH